MPPFLTSSSFILSFFSSSSGRLTAFDHSCNPCHPHLASWLRSYIGQSCVGSGLPSFHPCNPPPLGRLRSYIGLPSIHLCHPCSLPFLLSVGFHPALDSSSTAKDCLSRIAGVKLREILKIHRPTATADFQFKIPACTSSSGGFRLGTAKEAWRQKQ